MNFNQTSKAYKIFIPASPKAIRNRNVKLEDLASRKSHDPLPVIESEEQEDPKDEQHSLPIFNSRGQTSGEESSSTTPPSC